MSAQAHGEGPVRLRLPPEVDGVQTSLMGLRPQGHILTGAEVVTFDRHREVRRDSEAWAKRAARAPVGAPGEKHSSEEAHRDWQ
jgi:hypothetical protein